MHPKLSKKFDNFFYKRMLLLCQSYTTIVYTLVWFWPKKLYIIEAKIDPFLSSELINLKVVRSLSSEIRWSMLHTILNWLKYIMYTMVKNKSLQFFISLDGSVVNKTGLKIVRYQEFHFIYINKSVMPELGYPDNICQIS